MSNVVSVVGPASVSVPPVAEVLGVPVSCLDELETVAFIESLVQLKEARQICTADACGVALAQKLPELKAIYRRAALVTCDSVGVNWALARQKVTHKRVCGVDLLDHLCAASAVQGYRLYFVGSLPGVAELAATKMRDKYPGCQIVGTHQGYLNSEERAEVIKEIAELKVDLAFVGMGNPKQELFAADLVDQQAVTVAMGVGGSFDVISGRLRRAPNLVQKLRLEWLWRAVVDPRKVRKLILLPGFVWRVMAEPRR